MNLPKHALIRCVLAKQAVIRIYLISMRLYKCLLKYTLKFAVCLSWSIANVIMPASVPTLCTGAVPVVVVGGARRRRARRLRVRGVVQGLPAAAVAVLA